MCLDVGVISGAIKYIQKDFDLSTVQKVSLILHHANESTFNLVQPCCRS